MGNTTNSQDLFKVRCRNGHITTFNKWDVCKTEDETVVRKVKEVDGKLMDELTGLKCEKCGESLTVRIDCEGYK